MSDGGNQTTLRAPTVAELTRVALALYMAEPDYQGNEQGWQRWHDEYVAARQWVKENLR